MRKDLRIDGVAWTTLTVGGMDATTRVVSLILSFARRDLNLVMLSGCVVAWFNIIDIGTVYERTGIPLVCITYEKSEGLEGYITTYFPGDRERLVAYQTLGERVPARLATGHGVYIRALGISDEEAARVSSALTFDGKVPEPIRVARLCARGIMRGMSAAR